MNGKKQKQFDGSVSWVFLVHLSDPFTALKTQFETANHGILPVARHLTDGATQRTDLVPDGFAAATNKDGEVVYASAAQIRRLQREGGVRKQHENSDAFADSETVSSFWIPHLTPASKGGLFIPSSTCTSPASFSSDRCDSKAQKTLQMSTRRPFHLKKTPFLSQIYF